MITKKIATMIFIYSAFWFLVLQNAIYKYDYDGWMLYVAIISMLYCIFYPLIWFTVEDNCDELKKQTKGKKK